MPNSLLSEWRLLFPAGRAGAVASTRRLHLQPSPSALFERIWPRSAQTRLSSRRACPDPRQRFSRTSRSSTSPLCMHAGRDRPAAVASPAVLRHLLPPVRLRPLGHVRRRGKPLPAALNWISVITVGSGNSTWNHMPGCCGAPVVHDAKLSAPSATGVVARARFQVGSTSSGVGSDAISSSIFQNVLREAVSVRTRETSAAETNEPTFPNELRTYDAMAAIYSSRFVPIGAITPPA